ncbi:unnamed protein product [Staurois parvus]|uniref:Uncharacterized protein n=1 Tax=Staurois parvus TaxID=386267 RepID=A0ABN9G5U5_9NEOB|nr:unnamed protein product [Staurois parvus]
MTGSLIEEQSVYCRVEHSSLKEPVILHLDRNHRTSSGLIAGITIVTIMCVVGLAFLLKHFKKRRTGIVRSRYTEETLLSLG